ncbi:hypothetical protein P4O66_014887 [Electrophorus voltai]|uniref:Uncharacterized protein n=1 Tax=Electrophorus voltai TaxID=2609070 RepID=A0AAD9DPN7_9TELE|nr:hypothetical protein P4O66_014887 [Electrophorus voltai]
MSAWRQQSGGRERERPGQQLEGNVSEAATCQRQRGAVMVIDPPRFNRSDAARGQSSGVTSLVQLCNCCHQMTLQPRGRLCDAIGRAGLCVLSVPLLVQRRFEGSAHVCGSSCRDPGCVPPSPPGRVPDHAQRGALEASTPNGTEERGPWGAADDMMADSEPSSESDLSV